MQPNIIGRQPVHHLLRISGSTSRPPCSFLVRDCAFTWDWEETFRPVIGGEDAEFGEQGDGDADLSIELRAGVVLVERAFDDAGGAFDERQHDVVAGLFGLGLPGAQAFLEIGFLTPSIDGAAGDARLPRGGDDAFTACDGAENDDLLIAQVCRRKVGRFLRRIERREGRMIPLFSGFAREPLRAAIQRRVGRGRGLALKSVKRNLQRRRRR